jgi:N-dimethylarginine dimethylaminohydrolase
VIAWGRHYVMVEPTHFRVEYAINPFMDPDDQPDRELALVQWRTLKQTIERLGGTVDVIPQRPDAPDMVYAMNLGLAVARPRRDGGVEPHVVLSHMRYPQRRMETASAQPWFGSAGFTTTYVGRHGVGAHLEAGDVFPWGDGLVAGFGPRSEELALKHLAADLGVRVRGLRITHPGMYHLDLAFCPLSETRAIVCPAALDAPSAEALMREIEEPLVLTEEEALTTFAANSIVVPGVDGAPDTVVMPAVPDHVREQLEAWGFAVELVDVSEFHKGGGSIRCLTNPLDIQVGRDLPAVPGGEVLLPPV